MSREEIRELWGRFLTGEELPAEDQQRLVDALDADPELRESLLENLQLDGMLQAMNTTRRQGEGFVRNLTECLDVEHDGTRFVQKVELRLNEDPPPPSSGPGTGRGAKPPTARAFRRRSAASASGETAWKPALIAAGVFAAIFLLMLASSSPTAPRAPRSRPEQEPFARIPSSEPQMPLPDPKPVQPKPQIGDSPSTPLIPRQFPDSKPEERPAPPPPEEKRPLTDPKETASPGKTVVKPEPVIVPTRVEWLENNVFLARSKTEKPRAKKNDPVDLNVDVETPGASSSALLRFNDNTWVEVGGNSSFREVAGSAATGGRRVSLKEGAITSHIERQPEGRPMVFVTQNAEATVLGTTLRLAYTADPPMTTLEVKEGVVRLTRLSDKQSVVVTSGHFAVIVDEGDLRVQRNVPDQLTIRFGPAGIASDSALWVDSGDEFDAARGYGWKGPKTGEPVPGLFWREPNGKLTPKTKGRQAVRRTNDPKVDPLRSTDVVAGWAGHVEIWSMPVPNGRYLVTVCCGDATWEQGPHHVAIENVQVIDQKKNKPGQFIEEQRLIDVRDGELTMVVGSTTALRKSSDGSTDTILNYLIIKRIDPRKK
jgi:hypothetical protein